MQPLDSPAEFIRYSDSKINGTNMGPTWGRQDPGWPNVGNVNLAIRVVYKLLAQEPQPVGIC